MFMKIKAKLFTGIGILFVMIVLLTLISTLLINRLKVDTRNVLVANYNTLDYSRKMLIALDGGISYTANKQLFQENLKKQEGNITEIGENELTTNLSLHFKQVIDSPSSVIIEKVVRKDISEIMLLNMQAIERKSKVATERAENAVFWITLIGTVCFLISFTMFVNLPGNIANPIKEFTESIKEIADQNYSQRIHYNKKDEFGDLASSFNTMAEKLQEYQSGNLQNLLIEKKRIETLINNMHDPVIGLDDKKRILFMNKMALKIAGLKSAEVIGKPVEEIAVENDLIRSLIQEMFSEKVLPETKQPPVKIYADNKESYFEKEIIPIKIIPTGEKDESLIGSVILLQNITPYKELDFAKTNFIATVSHELKTPISAIKMSLQLLENKQVGGLNEEQQRLVDSIKDDAGRLLKITGELLNMTQVETGSIQMSVAATPPKEIVDYAVNSNSAAAEQKNIRININMPVEIPHVQADKDKTSWVLTNLVSNAIRYSYENASISIDVSNDAGRIKFSVTDTGQGIAPEYIDKIFDRYFRIPGTKREGTGLGLSISKEFIEAQGGSITVKSQYGVGSTFVLDLLAAK